MAPIECPRLVAADHDFHIGGIVPSVALVTEIPETANDSFFTGKVFVTTKDKVFEASSPFRHSSELIKILRDHYSKNHVELNVPILCLMTDGGPDHRLTYESVKVSLTELFMHLGLDMLIAIRTAPNHSWVNPAERCMSILNLALQHCALAREKMDDENEKLIRNKSSLTSVRNTSEVHKDLKTAFRKSIEPVIDTVNDRFSRMKLKGEPLTVYKGVSARTLENKLGYVKLMTGSPESSFSTDSKSADLKKVKPLQDFIGLHGKSGHNCFQLMKCKKEKCEYCLLHPVRDPDVFDQLHILPEPTPDEKGEKYLPFEMVFGQRELTLDTYRPSAKPTSTFLDEDLEEDKSNRELLKVVKVRDALRCGECKKPRCVYSMSKTTREQEELLLRIKEENVYTCGDDPLQDSGLVIRRAINFHSEMEAVYYIANCRHFLPPVCFFCGSEDGLLDDTYDHIEQLYINFSVVRPLCQACYDSGRRAKTWGQKFIKKRK